MLLRPPASRLRTAVPQAFCPRCLVSPPLRQLPGRIVAGSRGFRVSPPRQRDDIARRDHYERLGLRHDATPAEIKKSFYTLSKTHHPDANPNDPTAASTFSLLSEAYTVLSNASRRAAYDRDVLRLHHQDHGGGATPRGSYHSTNPAGGRSPSGLSRRRGTFRGPPPSFYRSGGWGAQGEKRRRAHEESTGMGGGGGGAWNSRYGGMGPGEDPFGHHDEVPHFDKESHTRTHRRQDERRWQRARRAEDDDGGEFEPQTSIAAHFLIVASILAATVVVPAVYLQIVRAGRRKREDDR